MNNSHTSTSFTMQTVPARIHTFLLEKIKQCVEMENQTRPEHEREMNVADFIRIAAAERVARILKEDVATIPPVVRGRGGTFVAQAAKKAGISTRQFEAMSAEIVAMQALGLNAEELMKRIMSGEIQSAGNAPPSERRPAAKSGQHQIHGRQVGHGSRSARRTG